MYWDIVEVKPEANHRLFVRFKDGLTGRVQLRREELTGALAPLLNVSFFEQVFIDGGALRGRVISIWHRMQCIVTSRAKIRFMLNQSGLAGSTS